MATKAAAARLIAPTPRGWAALALRVRVWGGSHGIHQGQRLLPHSSSLERGSRAGTQHPRGGWGRRSGGSEGSISPGVGGGGGGLSFVGRRHLSATQPSRVGGRGEDGGEDDLSRVARVGDDSSGGDGESANKSRKSYSLVGRGKGSATVVTARHHEMAMDVPRSMVGSGFLFRIKGMGVGG